MNGDTMRLLHVLAQTGVLEISSQRYFLLKNIYDNHLRLLDKMENAETIFEMRATKFQLEKDLNLFRKTLSDLPIHDHIFTRHNMDVFANHDVQPFFTLCVFEHLACKNLHHYEIDEFCAAERPDNEKNASVINIRRLNAAKLELDGDRELDETAIDVIYNAYILQQLAAPVQTEASDTPTTLPHTNSTETANLSMFGRDSFGFSNSDSSLKRPLLPKGITEEEKDCCPSLCPIQ